MECKEGETTKKSIPTVRRELYAVYVDCIVCFVAFWFKSPTSSEAQRGQNCVQSSKVTGKYTINGETLEQVLLRGFFCDLTLQRRKKRSLWLRFCEASTVLSWWCVGTRGYLLNSWRTTGNDDKYDAVLLSYYYSTTITATNTCHSIVISVYGKKTITFPRFLFPRTAVFYCGHWKRKSSGTNLLFLVGILAIFKHQHWCSSDLSS